MVLPNRGVSAQLGRASEGAAGCRSGTGPALAPQGLRGPLGSVGFCLLGDLTWQWGNNTSSCGLGDAVNLRQDNPQVLAVRSIS